MTRLIDIPLCQLSPFGELDETLTRLQEEGAEPAELWQAFNALSLMPVLADGDVDRRCWWQHLYAILERHGLAVPRSAPLD
ncbi:hypothetical protein [Dyella sp. C9]|uniref:hypothetical protein n=1 Tax=Dyella sp. C9 TaxID=2202154 RepID=UPI000DEEC5DB|nr:hypothetical protein [Dyella sp. C9]